MIDKLVEKILDMPEHKESVKQMIKKILRHFHDYHEEEYKDYEYKLYECVYGDHLSEELAIEWVSSMRNKDGTRGGHWTIEETSQYKGNYDKFDWYVVLNMMYSDFYSPKFSPSDYIQLAKDWLEDSDVNPNKLLHYYRYIVK